MGVVEILVTESGLGLHNTWLGKETFFDFICSHTLITTTTVGSIKPNNSVAKQ